MQACVPTLDFILAAVDKDDTLRMTAVLGADKRQCSKVSRANFLPAIILQNSLKKLMIDLRSHEYQWVTISLYLLNVDENRRCNLQTTTDSASTTSRVEIFHCHRTRSQKPINEVLHAVPGTVRVHHHAHHESTTLGGTIRMTDVLMNSHSSCISIQKDVSTIAYCNHLVT
jgi:hypothetical protein